MLGYPASSVARIAAFLCLACCSALAQTASDSGRVPKPPIIKLTAVMLQISAGTPWYTARIGLLCNTDYAIRRGTGSREPQELRPYATIFKNEMTNAGYQATLDDDLFDREDIKAADYQVGAIITDAHFTACMSDGNVFTGQAGSARGDGSMKVEWQVYSPVRKEVLARIDTSGDAKVPNTVPDGVSLLTGQAFAANVRALIATPEFRAAISAKPPMAQDVLLKDKQNAIVLVGSRKAVKRPIADTVGSVMTILTGNGSGSGVLLSDDGYVITDAHVVGDEKEVRVRWSDTIEKMGEVVRSSKTRDVAIIKTDPRGRPPVPIARGAVSPGQRVYAIGSPMTKELQGTVSSGVVSAMRTTPNGLNYIQSDVSVSEGSSGGPLLDESGAVLGLTDLGLPNQGQRAGLNLFTPIGDAMDFLSLEQD